MRIIVLGAVGVVLILTVLGYRGHLEARLLRLDPAALPTDKMLMRFATDAGRPLFEAKCSGCHGLRGQGSSAKGVPDLTDDDWLYGTGLILDIEQVVQNGIRSLSPRALNLAIMPAFATAHPSARDPRIPPLTPAEILDVIEYLYLAQGRTADRAAAARGATVFATHGGCYDCHAPDARGDPAIGAPNLTDNVTLYGDGSRRSLFMSIAYGRQGVCPAWVNKIPPAGIRETAAFVYSLSHGNVSSRVGH
jgi:cytochrome c oxidase cbb3-type subunit III